MKSIYIFFILLSIPFALQAQTETLLDRTSVSLSPSENRYNSIHSNMDVKLQQQLYANPAFYELLNQNKNVLTVGKHTAILSTGYSYGELDGDFLPAEGNTFNDFRITGTGSYSIKSAGTLFGSVQYAHGEHQNIGWSALRHPELYQPYISTDSIGGDFKYEDYKVSGGYSFRLDNLFLGVYGSFHGEQAHRRSDPRALNNTTWLSLGAGVGRLFNGHLLMIRGGYERNKQSMRLRYWRPGQQDRFFVSYGFGLYDTRLSGVLFGYSRMHYINQGNADVLYLSPTQPPLRIYADLNYVYDYMNTEESDIRDMYHSRTHHLKPTIRLDYTKNTLTFSLLLENATDKRKGYENIFEEYLADEANNIYDFRLIDTQQQYSLANSVSNAELRVSYKLPSQTFELKGGTFMHSREEKYTFGNYLIKNKSYTPYVGVGYQMHHKKSELDISALFSKKLLSDNIYNVDVSRKSIEVLDFQHAFTTYAYYNSTWSALSLSGTYVYHFCKYGVGVNMKLMYKKGDRDKDAIFTGKVGFDSSAPRITTTPDKHNEVWGLSSLFFVF